MPQNELGSYFGLPTLAAAGRGRGFDVSVWLVVYRSSGLLLAGFGNVLPSECGSRPPRGPVPKSEALILLK